MNRREIDGDIGRFSCSESIYSFGDVRNTIDVRFRFRWAIEADGQFVDLSCGWSANGLGQTVLQKHVVDRRQSQASTENVFDTRALTVERIDDGCSIRYERSLNKKQIIIETELGKKIYY